MFKELIEQRNIAKEAWDKARKEIQPLEDEYWKYVKLIDKKFIEGKSKPIMIKQQKVS